MGGLALWDWTDRVRPSGQGMGEVVKVKVKEGAHFMVAVENAVEKTFRIMHAGIMFSCIISA